MFTYSQAFSRNLGWVTEAEQTALQSKRIAIAGLGGVGGVHLLTLTRLGVGHFNLADFDTFDLPNFNRQAGASMATLGQPKLAVMAQQALDINPDLRLRRFDQGIGQQNVDEFLNGVDLYVDGLDFFAFEAREALFSACAKREIPAITAAPIGMGAALINFLPGRMTFDDYFGWAGQTQAEKAVRFVVGLSPKFLHRSYLVAPDAVSLSEHRTPSTAMACQMCAGVAATEALKILLRRGVVKCAPHAMQFDAYTGRLARTWRPGGHRNPMQQVMMAIARRQLLAA